MGLGLKWHHPRINPSIMHVQPKQPGYMRHPELFYRAPPRAPRCQPGLYASSGHLQRPLLDPYGLNLPARPTNSHTHWRSPLAVQEGAINFSARNFSARAYPLANRAVPWPFLLNLLSVCASRSVCKQVCMYVCMSVCMYVCMSVCLYVCMSVCLYVCMSVCLYLRMCVCMYIYIYIYVRLL